MVFAMLGQTESSGECEPTPSSGRSRHSPQIHLSAIAFVCYAVGAALCVFASLRLRFPICSPAAPGHACSSLRWPRLSSSLPLFSGTYRALSLAITTFALRNEDVFFEASSARRSKPIAAARRVGFSFRLAASAGTGSVVEALEEQGVHKLLRILQPLTGGNHETGSTRDLSYRACTWRLPPGIAGISADEARIDSSAFCSAIMSLS